MKKLHILILSISLIIITSFSGGDEEVKIWTQQSTINQAIEFEKSIDPTTAFLDKNVLLTKSAYPLFDKYNIARPIIIQRKDSDSLSLYAEYFFSMPDSIIRYISYDWEREKYANYDRKREIWKEEHLKLSEYNSTYEKIKHSLIAQLGLPVTQDKAPKRIKSTTPGGDYLSRYTVWKTDKYYSELDMIFAKGTYRIRWQYYWTK